MQLQHHSVIESCRLTHRRNDIIAYLTNLTHMAHIHPTSGIPPICVSTCVCFLLLGDSNPPIYIYIPFQIHGPFNLRRERLDLKVHLWNNLHQSKLRFFSPNLNRYTQNKKLSHLLQHYEKVIKKMPWKAQGSAERWWFIGGFLDLLCGLCLLSRKNSQELNLTIYTYQDPVHADVAWSSLWLK